MRTKAIVLAFALLLTLLPLTQATDSDPSEPLDLSVAGSSGQAYRFTALDFMSALPEEQELQGIIITSLPTTGTLRFSGRPLMEGEAVTAATLDLLSYMPVNDYDVDTSFSFLPVYAGGVSEHVLSAGIVLTHKENNPPIAQNMELKTYKNIAISGMFAATDPDGDALTFRITTKPRRGDMVIHEDNSFTYTPFQNKTGTDTIQYVAIDVFGNTSPEASVTVKIDKPSTKATYADMEGHPAYYDALCLLEAGVFTGENMCGRLYFSPDSPVSRAEFITMALKVVGVDNVTPVVITGFADDASMAGWVRPYAQAALKAGIISGVETADGRKFLDADRPITMAEAAVILNKAMQIANVKQTAIELGAVPAWAEQSVINMDAVGTVQSELVENWQVSVTRADAASMLNRSIEVYSAKQEKSGLLSWVFGW